MASFIGPPNEDDSDSGIKTPLRPSKTAYRDQPPLLTPSTTATSTSSLSPTSPQASVNSGTKRAIEFEHVSVPDMKSKRSAHYDTSLTGLNLSPGKILNSESSDTKPMALDSSDEDSVDTDPLIAHPTQFQWHNPSTIKESCLKILEHKSMDVKDNFTMGESIDVILNYLPAIDLKITLASVRPGSNSNITKPQLKNSIKKIVMKQFYRGYSLDQDIDELVDGMSKQARKKDDLADGISKKSSKMCGGIEAQDDDVKEVMQTGSNKRKAVSSEDSASSLSIAVHDGKGHIGNASFARGFNTIDPNLVEYKGKNDTDVKNEGTAEENIWKPSIAGFKKAMESQGPRIGNFYHVSHGFLNPLSMLLWYCIVMEFPPEVWFLKAGYLEALFIQYAVELGIDPPIWMTSFKDISIRSSPYGANEYKRGRSRNGQKGRTIGRIVFYFSVQSNEQALFLPKLRGALNKINRLFHPSAEPGVFCLQYLKQNASGIIDHFRNNLKTDAEIQNYLTECLVKVFHKRTYSLSFKNCLDRFMMDHDIKEFLETAGVSGWEGVGEITNVFKIYPQKPLPDWDAITMKSYSD